VDKYQIANSIMVKMNISDAVTGGEADQFERDLPGTRTPVG
jgi:hypothetical protein